MEETERGVQRVVRKASSRKRNPSESKKPESGNETNDNKNTSVINVLSFQSGDEKQGGKKRGRKRKDDVKVSDNEKNVKNIIPALEKEDSTMKSTKNDLPGISLRRSRKTRQSGSSLSDKETDTIIKTPDNILKLDEGRSSEREEQVSKISITSTKESEIKKSKSIQDTNEGNQINSNENIVEDTVDKTQSVSENLRRKGKTTAIKESGSKEEIKEVGERLTRHSTRNVQRTLSTRSGSISSESEKDCKSQEIPLKDTVCQQTRHRSKAISQKLKENVDQIESLSSELDTDIELQKSGVNKKSEEKVISNKGLHPKLHTTVRKRGRPKLTARGPQSDKKDEVGSSLGTESVSAAEEVLNKLKGKSEPTLPQVPKQIDSFSEGNEMTVTDISINTEMENEPKKGSASSNSFSKDSLITVVTEKKRKIIPIDTNNDEIYKSSLFREDNSNSQEKGSVDKKAEVIVVRGRRGRKRMHQVRSKKFEYETKRSSQAHSVKDLKNDGIASIDSGTIEVPNHDNIKPVIETRMSRKRRSNEYEESEKEKLENFPSIESLNKVQRLDSLSRALSKKGNLPLEFNKIPGDSDTELCSNKPGTTQRKNKKNLEKYQVTVLDQDSSNVKGRVLRGRKRRGGMTRRKSSRVQQSSADLAKRNAELDNTESYHENFEGNFLINLSVVVEKLDLNDPEIIKLMSHTENASSMEEKSKEIEMDPSINVNMDITASDTVLGSVQISTDNESLEKEPTIQIGIEITDETTPSNTEKLLELSKNQVLNLEISIQTENTLTLCDDQEIENIQSTGSEKLPVETKDVSICYSEKICNVNEDKSENTLESERPCEREIEEIVLESISNSLDSDISTYDKNKLSATISTKFLEKTVKNQNDLKEPIIGYNDETISNLLEYSSDVSRTSSEKTEEKNSNSPEINSNVPKTESDSYKIIENEGISYAFSSSDSNKDEMDSETVLLSVTLSKMKECYVNMSKAIDISKIESKKKDDSFCERSDTERKIPFNSSLSSTQNSTDTEDTNATFKAKNEDEKTGKELMVNAALEIGDVPDSSLEDEIVAGLEDNRGVNDELEAREVYNAAIIKDIKEITSSILDVVEMTDDDKVTEVGFQDKNNILEDPKNAILKESLVQSNVTLKDEIIINVLKSKEDVMHNTSENALVEVSEKSLEETVKSNVTPEQTKSYAGLETVNGIDKNKSDVALEEVDGVKEQEKSESILQLIEAKCEMKNADNINIEDLKEDKSNTSLEDGREVNIEHEKDLEYVSTEEEGGITLEEKSNESLNINIEILKDTSNVNLDNKLEVNHELEKEHEKSVTSEGGVTLEDNSSSVLKVQLKPKTTEALKPQLVNSNTETNKDKHTKDQTGENQNKVSAVFEQKGKMQNDPPTDRICFFAGDKEENPDFINSDVYKIMQKYFDMEPLPINFSLDPIKSKPGSSNSEVKPAPKRKFDEVEPKRYFWPSFMKQPTWEYLRPFIPVIRDALLSIMEDKPKDQLEYFSQWLKDHKAEAYFMMASIPLPPGFKLKKRKK